MMPPSTTTRRGQLLLAGPDLIDPNFARTVTLLVEHSDQGTLGLVLNRPLATTVAQAWSASVPDGAPCHHVDPLYHGGPCEGPLMVLHDRPERAQIEIFEGLYFTSDAEDVTWLMEHAAGHSEAISSFTDPGAGVEGHAETALKCFAGYAGWTGLQLESELERESWIVTPATSDAVFGDSDDLWFRLLERINPAQAAILRNPDLMPPDPSVN